MTGYVIRRLLWLAPVLFFVALITFVLMHIVPGGPWDTKGRPISPQLERQLDAKYGLDEPVWRQFLTFGWNALRGDLGISFQYQDRPVSEIIREGLKATAVLGIFATIFALVVGVSLGIVSALRQNSIIDYASVFFATFGASTPSFVLGILLIVIFAVQLGWLPVYGWDQQWWLIPNPKQAILPTITLGVLPAAYLARITRSSVLEVLQQDYVRTARAKGLHEWVVLMRHILRNALIPILTVSGPLVANLVTGSFIVETVFGIPGIGKQFVTSIFQRDYGMIMGTTLFYALVVAMANLVVDLLYGVVDPRIRY
ncbi:MAG: ABC transporter permease [Chloroflexi bacterium]|nr:ABC transporter permease [Chloroflexota bacterium]